jgi:hypothetical protein
VKGVGVHEAESGGSKLASGVSVYRLKAGHSIQLLSCEVNALARCPHPIQQRLQKHFAPTRNDESIRLS